MEGNLEKRKAGNLKNDTQNRGSEYGLDGIWLPSASVSFRGGSASFRLVVQAVASRIPLIYRQASKKGNLEKRNAGNVKKRHPK